MTALEDSLSAERERDILRFAAHQTEDITELEDTMAEGIQTSYQQSRAKAEQSSKDRHRELRKEWWGWVKASRYRNADNNIRGKYNKQCTHGTVERTVLPRNSGDFKDWP